MLCEGGKKLRCAFVLLACSSPGERVTLARAQRVSLPGGSAN